MLAVAVASILGLSLAGIATAHYVYAQGYVYKSSSHCTWGRVEISHGSGGGYTKISVSGVWAISSTCLAWWLRPPTDKWGSNAKYYAPGYARVRHELWKKSSNGSWSLCRSSAWKYNTYAIGGSAWLNQTWEHSMNYGASPPCGSGTYGVTGYMQVYESGVWRGGKLDGGQHYLPA